MADARTLAEVPDRQLLERFTAGREEAAFAALVRRHGPLVLGVSRRVLRQRQDAEDVFQATFLVLARKAGSIRKGEALGSWLHGVAYRIALKARTQAARRRARERRAEAMHPVDTHAEAVWRDLAPVLDEELQRLPANYRSPLILCYWQGKTHKAAALELGWPVGTLAWRLARARSLLQGRLVRRGITLSAGLLATVLAERVAAGVPPTLASTTVGAVLAFTAGKPGLSSGAIALAEEILQPMAVTVRTLVTGLLVLAAGFAAGAYVFIQPPSEARPAAGPEAKPSTPSAAAQTPRPNSIRRMAVDLHGDPLPAGALARLGTVRFRHGSPVCFAAFSPDGKLLATGGPDSVDNGIRLCDPATGQTIRRLCGPRDESVWCIAFAREGRTLISGGATWNEQGRRVAVITFWNMATGKTLHRYLGTQENENVCCLALSPDGRTLATGAFMIWKRNTPQPVRLWDAATGKPLRQLVGHQGPVSAVTFSADGKLLVSASADAWSNGKDRTIRVWEATTGRLVRTLTGHRGSVTRLAFVPGSRTLASGSWDETVRFWDVDRGRELSRLPGHTGGVHALGFSPNGRVLAVGSGYEGHTLRLWDVRRCQEIRVLPGHQRRVEAVAFSPTQKLLVSAGGDDHTVRLWDPTTGQELCGLVGHQGPIGSLAFLADGRLLTFSPDERLLRTWDPVSGRPLRSLSLHPGYVFCAAVSADGRQVAVAHEDKSIRLYSLATGRQERCCRGSLEWLRGLVFAPDGRTLASGGDDKVIRLWDVSTGKEQRHFELGDYFHTVAFSPDSRRLAAGGINAQIRVWDLATGKVVFHLDSPRSPLDALVFSPDGKLLAEGHCGWVELWDLAAGKMLHKLDGRKPSEGLSISNRCSLAFSPDGRTLAAAGWDDRVRLWELATGQERHRFVGHPGRVTCLAFARDGLSLVSGSEDTTALVWDLAGRTETAGMLRVPWKSRERKSLWIDLAATDSECAYRAMRSLAAAPRHALPLLKEHVTPVPVVAPERLARLIADLGSVRFTVRKKAGQELSRLGEAAESALRQELGDGTPLEMRHRVEQLLGRLEGPNRLRQARALEVLEMMPDRETRQLLGALARGAPKAWLTGEAKHSLKRWTERFAARSKS
jgi:RNA polymerase sigma factor (sigma-70 family)